MPIIEATSESFEKEVLEKDLVLVDFNAEWCGPCKMIRPMLEEIAETGKDIVSVNIDDEPELSEKYDVYSIPCLVVFEKSEEKARKIGLVPKPEIEKMLGGK